ncbi:A/G-specific adenine glycosylase [Sphingorhabdus arenilitoris]|uniref:Adenine DNA glycosylase n=1 Tax=Sphingorhabdus arenilitoris TaxID=1490041 RepID=A0ABV8RDJ6_9SPHN
MSIVQHLGKKTGDISAILLAHYDVHARTLPWRVPPGGGLPDPYHVWMSEIMLQQTTVAAVISYFEKFTARWPGFAQLAAAQDADVMAAWAGLGYYARARNLLKCARVVVDQYGGFLPQSEAELLKLPGIGPYTAAAITAIAFGQRAVVVDANVERVVTRLFAIGQALPAAKPAIRAAMDAITPHARSGDFAQAMMDLGAGLCSVKSPQCARCPLAPFCTAHQAGQAELYPVKPLKKDKPLRQGTAFWVQREGHILLVKRANKGMLADMRALPDDGWTARSDGDGQPPFAANWQLSDKIVQHSFTHFTLEMRIAVTEGPPRADFGEYWPINSLDKAGLPTLFSKAIRAILAERRD